LVVCSLALATIDCRLPGNDGYCSDRYCGGSIDDRGALPAPSGTKLLGDHCGEDASCESSFCLDIIDDGLLPFCTTRCGGSRASCPVGMACRLTTEGFSVCGFDGAPPSHAVGATCAFDLACASGSCIDVVGDARGRFCTSNCRGDVDCPTNLFCHDLDGLGPSCIY